jgi:hypothetical protein
MLGVVVDDGGGGDGDTDVSDVEIGGRERVEDVVVTKVLRLDVGGVEVGCTVTVAAVTVTVTSGNDEQLDSSTVEVVKGMLLGKGVGVVEQVSSTKMVVYKIPLGATDIGLLFVLAGELDIGAAFSAKTKGLSGSEEPVNGGGAARAEELAAGAASKNSPGDADPLGLLPNEELLPEEELLLEGPTSQSPGVLGEKLFKPAPYSTSGPGSGNTGSSPSTVVQEVTP